GREFNKIDTDSRKAEDIIRAVLDNRIVLNAGFFPEEGKYNRTACTKCYRQFTPEETEKCGGRCECGGKIKIGVRDRALSKSVPAESFDGKRLSRPPYLHIIPLAEIIAGVLNAASPNTKQCKTLYSALVSEFGTEIDVLTSVPTENMAQVSAPVADAVKRFREGRITLHPGGGGMYGTFEI
ncbi:MAG: endonuclease Q family protein, partial [Methanomicrobium sp.]|nr:endonuclease Q family protein [Methanomicrobium sp.]